MIDWEQVAGFDWNEGNTRKSADKHSVSQAEAEQVFFNEPLLVVTDQKHSQQEPRYHALGKTDEGRLLPITFTLRVAETLIRVISARDMHCKEKTFYVAKWLRMRRNRSSETCPMIPTSAVASMTAMRPARMILVILSPDVAKSGILLSSHPSKSGIKWRV